MRDEDAQCLSDMSSLHAGLCPAFRSLFTGIGSGSRGRGTRCAGEGESCACTGEVQYGTNDPDRRGDTPVGGRWTEWTYVGGSIDCINSNLGDPASGAQKECYCRVPDTSGLAGAVSGLAYAQRPNRMTTESIMSGSSARAMDGPVETLASPSTDGSLAACAAICVNAGATGYPFIGLQGKDQCFCGSVYNKRDGMPQLDDSECDITGDVTVEGSGRGIDCGTGLDPRAAGATNPAACIWRNAGAQSRALLSLQYVAFRDSQGLAALRSNRRCVCSLRRRHHHDSSSGGSRG